MRPLLGRERELAVVEGALAGVRAGTGRVLGIVGEAGIGKSALLEALAGRAAPLTVLTGRGAEHERDVPFGVVVDALDDHVAALAPGRIEALAPDLAGVLPAVGGRAEAGAGAAERFRHHRALRALLDELAPVALLLDDLHWADDASLELVLHLLRRPPREPLLLAFALRPGRSARRVLAAARTAPGWEQVDLGPLDLETSLRLLAGLEDSARERIAREAHGNPLFLRELERTGGPDLPATVLGAVERELAELPPDARRLLEGAAVAGDPFDPELAAAGAARPADADALDALVAADLVRATGHGRGFAFRHPLVRRAVYDVAPPCWRLQAHERVAAALERRGAAPAVRAYHVARFARPGEEAAVDLLSAAAGSAAATAPASAARWYAEALALVPETDTPRRAGLLGPLAFSLCDAGRLEEGRAAMLDALALTPRDVPLVVAVTEVEGLMGHFAAARARLVEALEDAPPEERPALWLALASRASYDGAPEELAHWVALAATADDPLLRAGAEGCAALAELRAGEPARAAPLLDTATARLRAADDDALAGRLNSAAHVTQALLMAERWGDVVALSARALALARRTHQGRQLIPLLIYRSGAHASLLDLHTAHREIEGAEESARLQRLPHALATVLWQSALIHHWRGEAAEARREAGEYHEITAGFEQTALIVTGACSLTAIGAEGDPERTIDAIVRAGGAELERVIPAWKPAVLLALVRAAIRLDRLEDAGRWAALAELLPAAPGSQVRAASARAEVLLARTRAPEAAALALEAVESAERAGARRDAADARLLAGRALGAAGETERAKAMLQRMATDAAEGGALRLLEAAARELRRLGTRVSSAGRRAARTGELTERENQIASLVGTGRTNKEVALELFLSEKTVEGALTRVYAKLGVRSRTELALLVQGA
jgi:DNA-binding CsgD family transcriptional regulator